MTNHYKVHALCEVKYKSGVFGVMGANLIHPPGEFLLTPVTFIYLNYLTMPNPRRELLVNGEIYHIYNKSVGEFDIFVKKRELNRLFSLINYYRYPQKVRYSKFKTMP